MSLVQFALDHESQRLEQRLEQLIDEAAQRREMQRLQTVRECGTTPLWLCAATAAMLQAKVTGILPADCDVDLQHVFADERTAMAHFTDSGERFLPCGQYRPLTWETLARNTLEFTQYRSGINEQIRTEHDRLLECLHQSNLSRC